jgi:hypothetical protein
VFAEKKDKCRTERDSCDYSKYNAIRVSINAMKASTGAIRENTFTIREVSLYRIFTSEIWGENGRILPFKPKGRWFKR